LPGAGIALGIAVVRAIRLANHSALGGFASALDTVAGKTSLEVIGSGLGVDEQRLTELTWLRAWGDVSPVIEGDALAVLAPNRTEAVRVLGVDVLRDQPIREYRLDVGAGVPQPTAQAFLGLLLDPSSVVITEVFADRHGLERVKTIGDAYMAVAGAPAAMADHAGAAVAMAVDVIRAAGAIRWPSGDQIVVHGGVATGPAVAGVIGRRKFAYDLWGDTVNVASRLEEQAEPGEVLVSEVTVGQLKGRYEFGPTRTLDLKGRGPTRARSLLGQSSDVPIEAST